MPPYSRRRFLKVSSIATMGIGTGTFLFTGCEPSPTGIRQDPTVGIWEMVSPIPVAAWTAALLPTGRVILFRDREQCYLWDPESEQWTEVTRREFPLYPWASVMPDEELIFYGPMQPISRKWF